MKKRKLYLGYAGPQDEKIQTIGDVRIDLIDRDDAHELFSQLIDQAYDDLENNEGEENEFTN